ncbi:MAG: hypothetical protein QM758_09550 [Armatimonas sp.]
MGKTQQFLTEVEAAIGRSVPAERRAEIIAETYAHLEDRAEDLAFGGAMGTEKAEEEALSAFGSARAYARNIAESFYEDGPRHKLRKLAFWSALLCIVLPMITRTVFYNPQYRSALLYSPAEMFYHQDIVFWVTLSVICSLCLGFLGRKCQTRKISLVFLCLLVICIAYFGSTGVLSKDGKFYRRNQLWSLVTLEPQPNSLPSYLQTTRLDPLEEGQHVFTRPAPIPARWRLPDGTFPVPAPKTEKWPEWALRRSQGRLSSAYTVLSEQEARRRWREDGARVMLAVQRHIQQAEKTQQQSMTTWRAILAKSFHPLAAFIQVVDSLGLWVLVILCDALGAALGRWVHRRTWKKKPSVPRKGAAA